MKALDLVLRGALFEGHDGAKSTVDVRGAYLFTTTSIRAYHAMLSRFVGTEDTRIEWKIWSIIKNKPDMHFQSIEELVAYRNPASAPIEAVLIACITPRRMAVVELNPPYSEGQYAASLSAISDNVDALSSLAASFSDELKNVEAWYSRSRKIFDSFRAKMWGLPTWANRLIVVCFVLLVCITIASAVYAVWSKMHMRGELQRAIEGVEKAAKEGVPVSSDTLEQVRDMKKKVPEITASNGHYVMVWIITMILSWNSHRFLGYIFPKAEFLIGDATERHAKRKTVRNYAIFTVLLSGVLLKIVISKVVDA